MAFEEAQTYGNVRLQRLQSVAAKAPATEPLADVVEGQVTEAVEKSSAEEARKALVREKLAEAVERWRAERTSAASVSIVF